MCHMLLQVSITVVSDPLGLPKKNSNCLFVHIESPTQYNKLRYTYEIMDIPIEELNNAGI